MNAYSPNIVPRSSLPAMISREPTFSTRYASHFPFSPSPNPGASCSSNAADSGRSSEASTTLPVPQSSTRRTMAGVWPAIFLISLTRSSAASRTHSGSLAGTNTVAVFVGEASSNAAGAAVWSDRRARVQTSCFMVFRPLSTDEDSTRRFGLRQEVEPAGAAVESGYPEGWQEDWGRKMGIPFGHFSAPILLPASSFSLVWQHRQYPEQALRNSDGDLLEREVSPGGQCGGAGGLPPAVRRLCRPIPLAGRKADGMLQAILKELQSLSDRGCMSRQIGSTPRQAG